MRSQLLLLLGLMCAAASGNVGGALAQSAEPSENMWEVAARYDYDRLSDGRADWHRWTLSLKKEVSRGTLTASFLRQRRFGVEDTGVQVDIWPDLWTGAYGHVEMGISPGARVRSQGTIRSEIFQSLGSWELSGRYSWRRYRSEDVHQFGPGLGRYLGSWYLRTRTSLLPRPGAWGIAQRVGARRFYGTHPSLSYVDVEGGLGRSVKLVNSRSELLVTQTFFVSLRVRHFLTSEVGITASIRYGDDEVFRRTGGTVGFFGQW